MYKLRTIDYTRNIILQCGYLNVFFEKSIVNCKKKMECTEEDWSVECSDDEKYEMDEKVK